MSTAGSPPAAITERTGPRLEHTCAEAGTPGEGPDALVLDDKGEVLEVLAAPVVVETVEIKEAVEATVAQGGQQRPGAPAR